MEKKKNTILRIENINISEECYEHLLKLKAQSGMTMKALVGLILSTCAKEIEFEFIEPKKIEVAKEE